MICLVVAEEGNAPSEESSTAGDFADVRALTGAVGSAYTGSDRPIGPTGFGGDERGNWNRRRACHMFRTYAAFPLC